MSTGLVHLVHDRDGGPGDPMVVALAAVARRHGWDVAILDDTHEADPARRLDRLRQACAGLRQPLLLAGCGMGGWVAAEASVWVDADGLFLIAPAVFMPGYPTPAPAVLAMQAEIVHGWDDETVPCEHAIRFARLRGCTLHLAPGDQRRAAGIATSCALFDAFLSRCA